MNSDTLITAVLTVNLSEIPRCIYLQLTTDSWEIFQIDFASFINQPSIRDCDHQHDSVVVWKLGKLSPEMYLKKEKALS